MYSHSIHVDNKTTQKMSMDLLLIFEQNEKKISPAFHMSARYLYIKLHEGQETN